MNKKIIFLITILFAGIIIFNSSCREENECDSPTIIDIKINPTEAGISACDSVEFTITLTPDINGELGKFCIYEQYGGIIDSAEYFGNKPIEHKFTYNGYKNVSAGKTGITTYLTFEATERKCGNINTLQAQIGIYFPFPDLIYWTGSLEYKPSTLDNTMMLVCDDDGEYPTGGTETNADLAFVWQHDYGYSIVSPDAEWITTLYNNNGISYSTSDKKNTKIMRFTAAYWEELDSETIDGFAITTETVIGDGNGVQGLESGDIIIFETADGRKGAFLVTSNNKVSKIMGCEAKWQAECW